MRPRSGHRNKAPSKTTKRKLSAAQLKARNRRHRIASKRARATATAVARAKARANVKAAAARRAAQKTARSHAKAQRFYCRVATRTAASVTTARSPGQYTLPSGFKSQTRPKKMRSFKPQKALKTVKG